MPTVTVRPLSAADVDDVVTAAVDDADPADVLPPDAGPDPARWTAARAAALAEFLHARLRGDGDAAGETSYLVLDGSAGPGGGAAPGARRTPGAAPGSRQAPGPEQAPGSRRVLGVARLRPVGDGGVETGLWLVRAVRGRGVASTVLALLADRARDAGATVLVADTTAGNTAALAALRRLGATLTRHDDGAVAARIPLTGRPRDADG